MSDRQLRNIDLRCVEIDGEPWFVAKDIFDVLSYPAGSRSYQLSQLGEPEVGVLKIQTPGGLQPAKIISESGLYKLVMRSDKPEAKEFQDWVTAEVLPAIRKDGRSPGCFLRKVCERIRIWPLTDFPPVPPVGR